MKPPLLVQRTSSKKHHSITRCHLLWLEAEASEDSNPRKWSNLRPIYHGTPGIPYQRNRVAGNDDEYFR